MATEQIRLQFIADMDQLKSQMLAGGASVEETEKRIQKLAKAYKVAEKAADKLAKEQEDSAKKTQSALKAIEGLGRVMGGPLGAATGALGDLSDTAEGATGAIGTMGIAMAGTAGAVAASAAAVVGYVSAMTALGDAANEIIDRVDEMGGAVFISEGARAAAEGYTDEMERLRTSLDQLTLVAAEVLLPTFIDFVDIVNDSIEGFSTLNESLNLNHTRLAAVAEILTVAVTGQTTLWASTGKLNEAFQQLLTGQVKVGEATQSNTKSFGEALAEMGSVEAITVELDAAVGGLEEKQRKGAEASKRHADELKRQADASAALYGLIATAAEAGMSTEDKIRAKYDERIAKIAELEAISGDAAAAEAARKAALYEQDLALGEERDKIEAARAETAAKQAAEKATADQAAHDAAVRYQEEEKAAFDAVTAARNEAIQQSLAVAEQIYTGVTDLAVWAIDKQIESMGHLSDSEKKEAKRLWALRQTAAISSIVMSGAVAYMNALATFAPAGWLAPILAAAVVGPPTALQIAQVASESPPSFAIGGVVEADHRMIQASPGEGVVTRRGMSALGPDGLAALNRGRMGGGGGEQLVMRYRHRDLSIVLRDHLRLDTPLARALDGATVPGRRTR